MEERKYNIFILGAGLGTRLRPLTADMPKPLIKLLGKEVINYNFEIFYNSGYREFIVNTSYKKEKYKGFKPFRNIKLIYSEENVPLGTGGGIKNAEKYLKKDDTIVMNGDIIYDFNVKRLTDYYEKNDFSAVMVLKPFDGGNVTHNGEIITSLRENRSKYYKSSDKTYRFTGLHVFSREFLNQINEFCIIDTYIKLLNGGKIGALIDESNSYWSDIGTLENFYETENYLNKNLKKMKYLNL